MPISDLMPLLKKNIVKAGNYFAARAKNQASSSDVPAVPGAIETGAPYAFRRHGVGISIKVNKQKMKGKDGRDISGAEWAYEEGSGLYGEKGETYPITPKKASVLAFPGKRSFLLERVGQSLLPVGAKGTMFFESVEHPGVGERPFFKNTLARDKDELVGMMVEGTDDLIWELIKEAWNVK